MDIVHGLLFALQEVAARALAFRCGTCACIGKSDSPVISSIAKQAILLNVVVFLLLAVSFALWLTVILIPILAILGAVISILAIVFPIFGAVKAFDGVYYRYPFVGVAPSPGTAGATGA